MHVCKHCQAAMRGSFADEDEVQRNPTRLITGLVGRPAKLLDSASPKTALGEALGYTSLVMYLLPHFQPEDLMRQEQGLSMCIWASPGCAAGCLRLAGPMAEIKLIDQRNNVTDTIDTQIDPRIRTTKPAPGKRKKAWLIHHFGPHYHGQLTPYGLERHLFLCAVAARPADKRKFLYPPGPDYAGLGSAAALQDARKPKRARVRPLTPAVLPPDMGESRALFGENAEKVFILGQRVAEVRKGHMKLARGGSALLRQDPGSGKTFQGALVLDAAPPGPALVVCPSQSPPSHPVRPWTRPTRATGPSACSTIFAAGRSR